MAFRVVVCSGTFGNRPSHLHSCTAPTLWQLNPFTQKCEQLTHTESHPTPDCESLFPPAAFGFVVSVWAYLWLTVGGAKQFSGWLLTLYIPDALILSWSSHVMVSTSFVLNVSAFYFILFLPACSFKEENIWSTSPVRSCFAAASSSFPFPQSVFVLIALDFSLCEREMWHHYSPI